MIPLAAFALAGCLTVAPSSDRIVAADLVPAFPALSAVSPDTPIGFAPAPGVVRVFALPELQSLAMRLHLAAAPEKEICMERKMAPLDPAAVLAAMQKGLPAARIEIVELSRQMVPSGEIEFPVRGLRATAAGAFWTGSIRYAGTRRFGIWGRVNVRVSVERVVAVADLHAGEPVTAAQIRLEAREEFPQPGSFALSVDQVEGRAPRTAIRAGSAIRPEQLQEPQQVQRGEMVQVEVRTGGARLQFEARAATSGNIGDTVSVLNPISNKRFRARVEGKGRVWVDGSAGK